jgi:hypothetical protein
VTTFVTPPALKVTLERGHRLKLARQGAEQRP